MDASAAAEGLQVLELAGDQGLLLLAGPFLDLTLAAHCGGFGGVFFLEYERNWAARGRPSGPCAVLVALYAGLDVFGGTGDTSRDGHMTIM